MAGYRMTGPLFHLTEFQLRLNRIQRLTGRLWFLRGRGGGSLVSGIKQDVGIPKRATQRGYVRSEYPSLIQTDPRGSTRPPTDPGADHTPCLPVRSSGTNVHRRLGS